jgi:hypothetical protein
MAWAAVVIVVLYLVMVRVVGRRYYGRRHGLSFEKGESGTLIAAAVGAAWPVTVWLQGVRAPQLCDHREHVLKRERILQQMEAEQRLVEQHQARLAR